MDKRDIENFPKIRKKHKSKTTNFYENLEQKSQILGKFGRNPIDYGSFSEEESVNLATPNSVRFLFLLVFPLLFYVIIIILNIFYKKIKRFFIIYISLIYHIIEIYIFFSITRFLNFLIYIPLFF